MRGDRRKYTFDWKLFIAILIPVFGIFMTAESRMTTVEVKLNQVDNRVKSIADINKDVFELKVRMSACERAVGYNVDGTLMVDVDGNCYEG